VPPDVRSAPLTIARGASLRARAARRAIGTANDYSRRKPARAPPDVRSAPLTITRGASLRARRPTCDSALLTITRGASLRARGVCAPTGRDQTRLTIVRSEACAWLAGRRADWA
jgi:hypothetical protein